MNVSGSNFDQPYALTLRCLLYSTVNIPTHEACRVPKNVIASSKKHVEFQIRVYIAT